MTTQDIKNTKAPTKHPQISWSDNAIKDVSHSGKLIKRQRIEIKLFIPLLSILNSFSFFK